MLADVVHVERVPVDAHFFDDLGADSLVMAQFCARVRKREDLPSVSMKDIYQHPTISSLATALVDAAPVPVGRTLTTTLAEVLAGIVHVDRVPVDAHFFDDLGADSMVMAQFCARVRKRADLPSVSMKDIYQHPTISSLATALADTVPAPAVPDSPVAGRGGRHRRRHGPPACGWRPVRGAAAAGLPRVLLPRRAARGPRATSGSRPAPGVVDIYLRSVVFGAARCSSSCAPSRSLAKWVLDRSVEAAADPRLEPGLRPLLARQDAGPVEPAGLLFVGSPLYSLYLRALGAKIGRGVAILSRNVPVCTDLLTIGDGTVIRKDSFLSCYRAHARA